jgi:hypothetical protein
MTNIEFFVTPNGLLDLPDKEPLFTPVFDFIACEKLHSAIRAIAVKYNIDYMVTRTKLVELYKQQTGFSFYGICSQALRGSGYVSEELRKLHKNS